MGRRGKMPGSSARVCGAVLTCWLAALGLAGCAPRVDDRSRLFNEDGVRVWAPTDLNASCRCSRERVATVLASLPRDEIADLKVNGNVEVTCEFCNSTYTFDDAQLDHIYS